MITRMTSNALPIELTESEIVDFLFTISFENGYSVAAWKLPESSARHLILSTSTKRIPRDSQLEELASGFIFAPFDRSAPSYFLPADLRFIFSEGKLMTGDDQVTNNSIQWLQEKLRDMESSKHNSYYYRPKEVANYEPDHFKQLVTDGVERIEQGEFEKVVPSRNKTVDLPDEFSPAEGFRKLCHAYPQAFVSVVSSPETGTWLGATPEELVRVFDKTIFKTVALAGTQPYQEGMNLRKVSWTQKEIEEQALVERYIISCFKKIRLREYDEHGPKTVIAGNLMHLRSDFTVNLKETNFPQLGTVMLQLLHPTSAVCGMPLESSLKFLQANEGYEREFYSGFLGPVNVLNSIDIFVNLRCMQLLGDKAVLYAGAGVTADSIPDQEWEETEMKMNTLLSVVI